MSSAQCCTLFSGALEGHAKNVSRKTINIVTRRVYKDEIGEVLHDEQSLGLVYGDVTIRCIIRVVVSLGSMPNVSETVLSKGCPVLTRPSFHPFALGFMGQDVFPSGAQPIPLDRAVQKSKWASRLDDGVSPRWYYETESLKPTPG
jgi:hypothetical protein